MGETIKFSEQCRGCPRVGELRLLFDAYEIDPLEEMDRADNEIEELREELHESDIDYVPDDILDESKSIALKLTAARIDRAEIKRSGISDQSRMLMESCKGLLILTGQNHDGEGLTVRVCGSSALHGMSVETTRVDRP